MTGDYYGNAPCRAIYILSRLFQQFGHSLYVIRVNHFNKINTTASHHPFKGYGLALAPVRPYAQTRGRLHTCHGCDLIVQDYQDKACVVVDSIQQPCRAGVKKGGIPDSSHNGLCYLVLIKRLIKT